MYMQDVPFCLQSKPLQQQLAAQLQQAAAQRDSPRRQYLAAAATAGQRGGAGLDAVLLLREVAEASDILQGYCAALMLAWNQQVQQQREQGSAGSGAGGARHWPPAAQLALADVDGWLAAVPGAAAKGVAPSNSRRKSSSSLSRESCATGSYQAFLAALGSVGWALDRVALLQGQSRLSWGNDLRAD
jgi:hypothetical protein